MVAEPEPIPLLVRDDIRLLRGVDPRVEHHLGGIIGLDRGVHDALKLSVILGESLELVDRGVQLRVVRIAGLHLVDGLARLFRLKGIFRKAGGDGYVTKIRVGVDSATALFGDYFRIHFYGAPVASVLDNLAYPVLWANIAARDGYVDMPALTTEGSGSDMTYALAAPGSQGNNSAPSNIALHVENKETVPDVDLYLKIEEISTTPGTPAANQPIFVEVTVDNN